MAERCGVPSAVGLLEKALCHSITYVLVLLGVVMNARRTIQGVTERCRRVTCITCRGDGGYSVSG